MYNRSKQVFSSITYLLLPGGLGPRHALPSFLLHSLSPLLVRWPTRIGASGPRLQGCFALAKPAAVQSLNQPQENSLPRVPGEQSVDQSMSRPHDLARHLDHRRAKRRELHPQQRSLLSLVLGRVPRRYRCQQGTPSFQAPRQRGHYHVRPIADQVVHWRRECVHSALELGDQVFLVAPLIGREHNLFGRGFAVVGDIEEVAILLEQPQLRLVNSQQLADYDDPITLAAGDRAVVELGDHLLEHVNRLEPPLFDDLLLDAFGVIAPVPRIMRLFWAFSPSNSPESPYQEESSLASMIDTLEARCRSGGPPAGPRSIDLLPVSKSFRTASSVA